LEWEIKRNKEQRTIVVDQMAKQKKSVDEEFEIKYKKIALKEAKLK